MERQGKGGVQTDTRCDCWTSGAASEPRRTSSKLKRALKQCQRYEAKQMLHKCRLRRRGRRGRKREEDGARVRGRSSKEGVAVVCHG